MNETEDYSEELRIVIDVDGYKDKRVESIKELAAGAVEKVIQLGQDVSMPAMNAYERHVVHEYIQETYPDVKTSSIGEEPNRRVVIHPAGSETTTEPAQ